MITNKNINIDTNKKVRIIYFIPFICFLSTEAIDTVSGVFISSKDIITEWSIRFFMQVQFFEYSSISQYLSYLQVYMLGFKV